MSDVDLPAVLDHIAESGLLGADEMDALYGLSSKLDKRQWIEVRADGRLPEECTNVLVYLHGRVVDAWFSNRPNRQWLISGDDYEPFDAVSHWMPYPEPPK